MYLKLVRPSCEYAEQVMQYKEDMLANNDSSLTCGTKITEGEMAWRSSFRQLIK